MLVRWEDTAAPGCRRLTRLLATGRPRRRVTCPPRPGGPTRVRQDPRRQPWGDRRPRVPRGHRARRQDGRRLPPRGPPVRAPPQGRRVLPDRRGGPPRAGLPRPREHRAGGRRVRRRRDLPGLRVPVREPAARRGVRGQRHHLHRPAGLRPAPRGQQVTGDHRGARRRPADPRQRPAHHRPRRAGRRGRGHRLPGVRQGRLGRRRPRHAPRRRPLDPARVARGGPARGRRRLRRPHALPRAGRGEPAAHRGAGARRLHRHRAAPVRARLLGAATPPEGRRDRPGAEPRPGDPRADVRRRRALRRVDRLPQRGHRRVPPRRGRPLRLHRDEPADPGRAHRHRGGHRRRPRRRADADRLR